MGGASDCKHEECECRSQSDRPDQTYDVFASSQMLSSFKTDAG